MKKILILFLVMSLLLVVPTTSALKGDLQANLIRYEPLPARPGQYVTIFIKIENIANDDAPNAYIEVIDSFPFTSTSESNRKINIGQLKSYESYVAEFKLKVDSDAVAGLNTLKIRFATDDIENNFKEKELLIDVKPSEARLTINKIEFSPEQITPGQEGNVNLVIKNSASIFFRDVSIKLNLDNVPFIPLNTVSEKQIALLKPNELSQVSFPISVYPSASPGYYKIPLEIYFYDDQGNKQEQSDIIGIIVSASPELKLTYDTYSLKESGAMTLKIKVINKGISDLKLLDLEILPNNYEIIKEEYYLGDLDSDDYRTSEFEIKTQEKEFIAKIKATYRDENNKLYEELFEIPINITNGEKHTLSFSSILLILIIIAIGIYVCYKFKHKNKHK